MSYLYSVPGWIDLKLCNSWLTSCSTTYCSWPSPTPSLKIMILSGSVLLISWYFLRAARNNIESIWETKQTKYSEVYQFRSIYMFLLQRLSQSLWCEFNSELRCGIGARPKKAVGIVKCDSKAILLCSCLWQSHVILPNTFEWLVQCHISIDKVDLIQEIFCNLIGGRTVYKCWPFSQ